MVDYEKLRKQEVAYPIPTALLKVSVYNKNKDIGMGYTSSCFLHSSEEEE